MATTISTFNSTMLKPRCESNPKLEMSSRRHILVSSNASIFAVLGGSLTMVAVPALAEDNEAMNKDDRNGVVSAIKTLFDPNEKTKSGKVLPKSYLKSARDVVRTLHESLKEDPKDNAKFRRTADAAKESIREYFDSWRGQEKIAREESYVNIEKAIRSLASFYSKAGPSASLPEEVKSEILSNLVIAEEFL